MSGPKSSSHDGGSITPEQKAMVAKAAQAWKNDGVKAKAEYLDALRALPDCPILDMAQITNKNDLLVREAKAKNYLSAAQHFLDFIEHASDYYTKEVEANIPDKSIRKILLEEYPTTYGKILSQALVARKAEVDRAEYYVKGLKLLEDNWGQWEWRTNGSQSPFITANDELAARFQEITKKAHALGVEEEKASEESLARVKEVDKVVNQAKK